MSGAGVRHRLLNGVQLDEDQRDVAFAAHVVGEHCVGAGEYQSGVIAIAREDAEIGAGFGH